jgi:formylglycine-generating enzyme required for sulfatase activity
MSFSAISFRSMSLAPSILFAALLAGPGFGCKQSSPATERAPLSGAEPQRSTATLSPAAAPPAATQENGVPSGHAALAPPSIEPPRAPEGMVYIPGASFDMGPPQSVTLGKAPQRVQVSPLFLDRTEVTVAAYLACVGARGCTAPKPGEGCNATAKKPRSQHPVNCITKGQAEQYCAAQGKRLPSAAEWELAARGTDGRSYPWGNAAAGEQLCWQGRAGADSKETCPVGSFPDGKSPFGALDMAGNVAEWTSTEVTETAGPGAFFTRGGSYSVDPMALAEPETLHIRADQSEPFSGTTANASIGVRCAKSL